MLNELMKRTNITYTENGAVTLRSTQNACLDLFATIGALRNAEEKEIICRFLRAWAAERDTAMKMLFYSRDVRGGLGERRTFRVILRWLAQHEPASVKRNLHLISEYGRWDDLLVLLGTSCEQETVALIRRQLQADLAAEEGRVSLLGKWLPSVNASSEQTIRQAKRLARLLGMKDAEYRRMLVKLRAKIRVLENNLREKDYTFDYGKQPAGAMLKYRRAFIRNDRARYLSFLRNVSKGTAEMHTGTLTPWELVRRAMDFHGSEMERQSLDVMWNALGNSLENDTDGANALCIVDGSGSMYAGVQMRPIDAALSLGLYFAERSRGAYRNHFMTFSTRPQMVQIQGRDLVEKVRYCESFNEVADTNIQGVFELLLQTALEQHVPPENMPDALYFITDMEFNCCTAGADRTNFEYAKQLYAKHGYQLPQVIFWTVNSRSRQQPVAMNEQGVILVSGASARIFSMVAAGALDPCDYMRYVLGDARYAEIAA